MLVNCTLSKEACGVIQKGYHYFTEFVFLAPWNTCRVMDSTANLMILEYPHSQYKKKKSSASPHWPRSEVRLSLYCWNIKCHIMVTFLTLDTNSVSVSLRSSGYLVSGYSWYSHDFSPHIYIFHKIIEWFSSKRP